MTWRLSALALALVLTGCSAEPDPIKDASQDPSAVLSNAAYLLRHFDALEAASIPGLDTSEEGYPTRQSRKIVIGPYIISSHCGGSIYMATERTILGGFDTYTSLGCENPKVVRILSASGADGASWVEPGPWQTDLPARLAAYRKALEEWQANRVRRAAELLK